MRSLPLALVHDLRIARLSAVRHLQSQSASAGSRLRLYDSLSETIKEIPLSFANTSTDGSTSTAAATEAKALAWYTCGPTTYAAMHLGHARTYVWLDMMRRIIQNEARIRVPGLSPLFVMNITDIDDKILNAATDSGTPPLTLSRQAEANFWKDMDRLNCLRPHVVTRVSEFVQTDIVPYIQTLVDKQMAYASQDGVYFHVQEFEAQGQTYGKLAGKAAQAATQPQTSTTKKDPRDFALWKLQKEGEDVAWPSPWGNGRPGWHIECSAMIEAIAKQFQHTHQFLVHAGGHDLKFPHHTNEIAQAEAYHHEQHEQSSSSGTCTSCSNTAAKTTRWIPHWVHTGHLMIKEAKMSKSLKNFLTVDELWFDGSANDKESTNSTMGSPADDFRMWCLMGGSYKHKEEYSRSRIRNARQQRQKILQFFLDGEQWIEKQQIHAESTSSDSFGSKRWSDHDHELFNTVSMASADAYNALLDDMHGTRFVDHLLRITEEASVYMRRRHSTNNSETNNNVEPMKMALQSCRDLLSLVGFSPATVNAGLTYNARDEHRSSQIVGGEKAIIEELIRFREQVRKAALEDVKQQKKGANYKSSCAKNILKACDELRDALPALGLQVMDGKQQTEDAGAWKYCVPKGTPHQ
ncbi:Cysteine--tRNA ligase [Seminavis robusta]|uniref:Cysteine--tRNA ligase n=1 Tax=Seminavis robusta TaxID=568900 RepID=A0A9N8EQJ8_9STRA|nr:Cysteine--tRNA ligase [Seminavis robusta]|eukprot:Sro1515_g279050.1 Cysteine--tRNA ligase (636) ;mRNA; r:22471-24378